jgi:hypothetical protein
MPLDRIKEFIISGPGRTGGHILLGALVAAGYPVIYTHDPLFERDQYHDLGLIISLRRDLFAATISNAITCRTGQSTDYTIKILDPFDIDIGDYKHVLDIHLKYQARHDLSRGYGLVETFYFEDFVNDYSHIYDRLGIHNFVATDKTTNSLGQDYESEKYFTNKAPYHYKDVVSNWKELKQIFDLKMSEIKSSLV